MSSQAFTEKFVLKFKSSDIGKIFVFIHPFTGNRHELKIIDCIQAELPEKIENIRFKPNCYTEQLFYKITPDIDRFCYHITPANVNPSSCILSINGDESIVGAAYITIKSGENYGKNVRSVCVNKTSSDREVIWKLYVTKDF